jgi:hypothetical protein
LCRCASDSTAENREPPDIKKVTRCKQFRSHSLFDRTSLSLERLREMKTTWDNEESDQRKALTKMLDNMKELIKEQEENNSNAFEARRLSVQYHNIGFKNSEENVWINDGSLLEEDKMDKVTNDKIKGETTSIIFNNQYGKVILYCFIFHFSLLLG